MRSKIEPDRYADTGFSVMGTPPDINRRMFEGVMALSERERLKMRCSMFDTARKLVLASLPSGLSDQERRKALYERMYSEPCPVFSAKAGFVSGD
jgi:hypothetical protein